MGGLLKDFVGSHLADEKEPPKKFLVDKAVAFLSFLTLSFIVIDSFITLLPIGPSQIVCLVKDSSQQAFSNAYCSDHIPIKLNLLPLGIFGQAIIITVLHYVWYSTVHYVKDLKGNKKIVKKPRFFLYTLYFFKNSLQIIIAGIGTILVFIYEIGTTAIPRIFTCTHEALGNETLNCVYTSTALNNIFLIFYGFLSGLVVIAALIGLLNISSRSDLYNQDESTEDKRDKVTKGMFCCWCWCRPEDKTDYKSLCKRTGYICCNGCHLKTPTDWAIIQYCFPINPSKPKELTMVLKSDPECGQCQRQVGVVQTALQSLVSDNHGHVASGTFTIHK